MDLDVAAMDSALYYSLNSSRLGTAAIINNLHTEQEPTQKDVARMAQVLEEIGFNVEIHRDLTSQGMNSLKRQLTLPELHADASCFLLLVISHGTADNFLQDKDGAKTWNIESLVTEMCDVPSLVGKPKLFFIEACRGREHNMGRELIMTKSSAPLAPRSQGISLPNKQDVFVGFATVPGFVSFTSSLGSPYLQALASVLSTHYKSTDMSDIHLLVKRRLAALHLGKEGARQGAEERSSLLSKLLFSNQVNAKGSISELVEKKQAIMASSTPQRTTAPPLPPAIPPLSPINVEIQRQPLSRLSKRTSRGITITKEPRKERVISQGGDLPRASIFSFPYSSGFPSAFTSPPLELHPVPEVFSRSENNSQENTLHVIEIHSSDVEAGLNQLLERVTEVYGGKGKVKVRRRLWGAADEKDPKKYSVKYLGPERAAAVLEKALRSVKDLQGKSSLWKFTQRLEVSTVAA